MRHLSRAPLALALLLALLASILTTAPASADSNRLKVVDANVDSGPTDVVMQVAAEVNAHAVTMQEICASEFFRWRDAGWVGQFTRMTEWDENDNNGCRGQEKGEAVLHRSTYTSTVDRLPLPSGPGGKEFNLTCLKVNGLTSHDTRVCTTHLWAGHSETNEVPGANDAIRTDQINKAREWLDPWAGWARHVVFTGDLNTGPGSASLDPIYANYREASGLRTGAADTIAGRKVDYVFGDRPVTPGGLETRSNAYSDHAILVGYLTF